MDYLDRIQDPEEPDLFQEWSDAVAQSDNLECETVTLLPNEQAIPLYVVDCMLDTIRTLQLDLRPVVPSTFTEPQRHGYASINGG